MIQIYSAKEKKLTSAEFAKLYDIVRIAYAETEKEMFGEHYIRIDPEEFKTFIDNDQILVAFKNGRVMGGVRHFSLGNEAYSFGLLASDFEFSQQGIGRALLNRVEEIAMKTGAKSVRIEILRPKDFELSVKTRIGDWYKKLGYRYRNSVPFESVAPEKAELSITPCIFDFYIKKLDGV